MIAVEQVPTFGVAVAKSGGTAEIIASNSVGGAWNCLKIRQEIIQLINQTRKDNGVPELPVSESLMNAAQVCSNRRYT